MVPNPIRQPCKNNSFRCLRGGGLHVPTPEVFPENGKNFYPTDMCHLQVHRCDPCRQRPGVVPNVNATRKVYGAGLYTAKQYLR